MILLENLENLWIIDSGGHCYLTKIFDPSIDQMDEKKFAGFIMAIFSFTNDLLKDKFNKLILGEKIIFIQPCKAKFFVIITTNKKMKQEKELLKSMTLVGQSFSETFSDIISNNFTPSKDLFENFSESIDKFFKK